jgi:hypothetical protein
VCVNTYSQIINFPDANFKAKLLESDSGVPIAYGIFPGGSFKIDANDNGEIEVSELLNVGDLNVQNSNISDLTGIEYFTNLKSLRCENNLLTELDVSMLSDLRTLGVYNNSLTDLNIAGLSSLRDLYASGNSLSSIDFTGLTNLNVVQIDNNQLAILDFNDTPNIYSIDCFNNQLTTLDVSNITELISIDCSSNLLESLNVKNEFSEYNIHFSDNDNLQYICADDSQLMAIQDKISEYGYTNCFTNSLCSFVQGEDFYSLSGNIKYDEDGNGCDLNDIDYPELVFSISDETNLGFAFADTSGNYTYSLQAGNYTFTPSLENTTYFSITPENVMVAFPEDADSNLQDFCVSSNGVYPDLEITMDGDSSGYNTFVSYRIKYTNKGTMTQSGIISITYEDEMAVFSSSIPVISSQNSNELVWSFTDLKPFESRDIEFIMDVTAVEENMYDEIVVNYIATINSNLTDTTPDNNAFEYNQPFFCCLLNTSEFIFSDYFSMHPNPSKTYLNIKIKKEINVKSLTIYNVVGQLVEDIKGFQKDLKLDISQFNSGQYFIKIITTEAIFTTRFIKQ